MTERRDVPGIEPDYYPPPPATRMKPPPTPAPKLPVDPEPENGRARWTKGDKVFFGGMAAFVAVFVVVVVYGVTRKVGPCIGWEPAAPVYRFDGVKYVPEPRWRCVEWGSPQ